MFPKKCSHNRAGRRSGGPKDPLGNMESLIGLFPKKSKLQSRSTSEAGAGLFLLVATPLPSLRSNRREKRKTQSVAGHGQPRPDLFCRRCPVACEIMEFPLIEGESRSATCVVSRKAVLVELGVDFWILGTADVAGGGCCVRRGFHPECTRNHQGQGHELFHAIIMVGNIPCAGRQSNPGSGSYQSTTDPSVSE